LHTLHAMFSQAFEYNLLLGSLVMFFLGFAMSINPCMVGMASSAVALARTVPRRGAQLTVGVILTISFVLTLIIFGGILAFFGKAVLQLANVGEKLIAVIFLLLGLYLLGIRPARITGRNFRSPLRVYGFYTNGKWSEERALYLKGMGLGSVFGFIPQPCTTPALLAIITYITTREEVLAGLILLLAYGLGNGVIFLLSGVLADKLSKIRSNRWSRYIDRFFGLILLLVAGMFYIR